MNMLFIGKDFTVLNETKDLTIHRDSLVVSVKTIIIRVMREGELMNRYKNTEKEVKKRECMRERGKEMRGMFQGRERE